MKPILFITLPFAGVFCLILGGIISQSLGIGAVAADVLFIVSFLAFIVWLGVFRQQIANLLKLNRTKSALAVNGLIILVTLITVGLGFLSTKPRFNQSVDVTRDQVNTLSDASFKLIESLKKNDVTVKLEAFLKSSEEAEPLRRLISLYEQEGLKFQSEYIDADAEPAKALANNVSVSSTAIFKWKDREARITSFTEEKITNALASLQKVGKKKILFTSGHGEADLKSQESDGLGIIEQDLMNNSFEVNSISLLEAGGIPNDTDLVVVAGPKYDFSSAEATVLESYLLNGGSVVLLISALVPLDQLNTLTSKFGIKINNDLILLSPDDPRAKLLGQNNVIVSKFDEFHTMTSEFSQRSGVALIMSHTRSLDVSDTNEMNLKPTMVAFAADTMVGIDGVKREKDLETNLDATLKNGPFGVIAISSGMIGGDELAASTKVPSEENSTDARDATNPPVSAAKSAQLIVSGSIDFATNLGVQRSENYDMFMSMVNTSIKDSDFIVVKSKEATKSSFDMSSPLSHLNLVLISFVYPFMFLGFGVITWLRRRAQ